MILSKLFGTKSQREIKKLSSEVDKINHSYKLFSEILLICTSVEISIKFPAKS